MTRATAPLIRPARLEDMDACAAIHSDWIDTTEWMPPRTRSTGEMARDYREGAFVKRRILVAELGGEVAGYLSVDEPTEEITALFVGPRGRGIGTALMLDAQDRHARLWLWTFQRNEGARRFYTRRGFAELERTTGDNEETLPDVRLGWRRGEAA
ncbi:GNAT family N-acetyltransferase [Paracoccus aurantiacus]|uniref:GNAT family N-acetyltransferase n=1 Tax=Paracoccus aurantiacus TaxID=2599412 RepID=A0A5C6S2I7_9RHOB|nr:GNAT family N-acetyltransferase [Paracoccus aurantiacus]TXB68149.1 GNAT family N-acetyltransferase [Paracoccus aurantiacus]